MNNDEPAEVSTAARLTGRTEWELRVLLSTPVSRPRRDKFAVPDIILALGSGSRVQLPNRIKSMILERAGCLGEDSISDSLA